MYSFALSLTIKTNQKMNTTQNLFNFYVEKTEKIKSENPSIEQINWEIEIPFSEFEKLPPNDVDYSKNHQHFRYLLTNYNKGCLVWFKSPKCILTESNQDSLPNYKPI